MAEKQISTEQQEAVEVQQGSKMGGLVRYALVALLVVYALKPYFFPEAQTENSTRQNFAVHGRTMGSTWSAIVCASPEELVEINSKNMENESETLDSCEDLLMRTIQRELDRIDSIASTYRSDSEISKFNASRSTDWFDVSPETATIVSIALEAAKNTEGAFDPTIAPLVNLYRFGPNKSPLTQLPTDEQIAEIKKSVGFEKLTVRLDPPAIKKSVPELTLDLSGVAKGYSVDVAGSALEKIGLNSYMIEVGGEIRCRGKKVDLKEPKPWTIGVQTPEVVANELDRVPEMYRFFYFGNNEEASCALATSGDYRNYLQVGSTRFSHILDPRTGKPTELLLENEKLPSTRLGSVSVLSDSCANISCALADAYATAFFVLGADKGVELANKLNVPVLYIFRSDDSATILTERNSDSFAKFESKTLNEVLSEQNATESGK